VRCDLQAQERVDVVAVDLAQLDLDTTRGTGHLLEHAGALAGPGLPRPRLVETQPPVGQLLDLAGEPPTPRVTVGVALDVASLEDAVGAGPDEEAVGDRAAAVHRPHFAVPLPVGEQRVGVDLTTGHGARTAELPAPEQVPGHGRIS
jgi:hypothetical protein